MKNNRYKETTAPLPKDEQRRRRREYIISVMVIGAIAVLSYLILKGLRFDSDLPVSNSILIFILININLLLILLLIFLLLRNIVKVIYERRRKVEGSRLRTKLVAAFISLTLLPTIVLFAFSLQFINQSIEFWFRIPVDQSLTNALAVGKNIYKLVEDNNTFFLDKAAYQVATRDLLSTENEKELSSYVQVVQRAFNLNVVEVYDANARRLVFSVDPSLPADLIEPVNAVMLARGLRTNAETWSISEPTAAGEMIRNIAAIPFGASEEGARGFIVISVLLPPDLARNLDSITQGFEEYQQTKILKDPIRLAYYITLTIVALLVVFCAVWFGMYVSRRVTVPIMELAEGTRRVAGGDLTYHITVAADDEIKTLVDSFNKMTRDLRFSRRELELYTRKLFDQNIEIEERRRYMEIVLDNVSAGVISIDAQGLVTTINHSAEKMLSLRAADIIRKSYKHILENQHADLAEEIYERFWEKREESLLKTLRMAVSGKPKLFMVNFNALKDDSGRQIGLVMVFDDMTELEKAQRMAAWREVARRIAHEVKNPLTPISLSAQRLWRKYRETVNDPVFEECTRTIIDHTELIRNLVNEFSAFARFPTANPVLAELAPIITETVGLYREGHPNITFEMRIDDALPVMKLDRQQIKQTLINLIDNAVAAMGQEGTITIEAHHNPQTDTVTLAVADTGPGISEADKPFMFEPDFTTKKTGMGLGLAIVSTIISDHKGKIHAENNHPTGARFVIELPVTPPPDEEPEP
jgi:two-component system, NtrC family, nitrogen regulation sensor histidine kinase NtrY